MGEVKYDRQWVYYGSDGEPHPVTPPVYEFDRIKDLQEHLNWIQAQIDKLMGGLPSTTMVNQVTPIHIIEWQALDNARVKAENEAKHWKQAYDLAEDMKNHFWNQLNTAEAYLKQIKARSQADRERNRSSEPGTYISLVEEAFEALARGERR